MRIFSFLYSRRILYRWLISRALQWGYRWICGGYTALFTYVTNWQWILDGNDRRDSQISRYSHGLTDFGLMCDCWNEYKSNYCSLKERIKWRRYYRRIIWMERIHKTSGRILDPLSYLVISCKSIRLSNISFKRRTGRCSKIRRWSIRIRPIILYNLTSMLDDVTLDMYCISETCFQIEIFSMQQ